MSIAGGPEIAIILGSVAAIALAANVTIRTCDGGGTCRTSAGERIRLACIDVPELMETPRYRATSMQVLAYDNTDAYASRDHLNTLVEGQSVVISRLNMDRDGRTVAELFVNGTNIQQEMVASGHAVIRGREAHQCSWTQSLSSPLTVLSRLRTVD